MGKKVTFAVALIVMLALSGSAWALTDTEKLGGLIYRDTNLSINQNQSCMTCHHPSAGFEDPVNLRDPENYPVSEGSEAGLYGGRNAPTAAYAGFSPIFGWYDKLGGYAGGMFWDGRATGDELDDPLAEQARGPFQNPVEMGLSPAEVVAQVEIANYAPLFLTVYPDTDWNNVPETYNNIARAIAAYERSTAVTRFTSKFDLFWNACVTAGINVSDINESTDLSTLPAGILSTGELKGLALFNGKAGCAACHVSADFEPGVVPPLFTNYTYDNIGIPTNPRVYELAGGTPPDLGLGGRLNDVEENGKFKVPTLRNVAKSTPYGHNGYFISLNEIVNFFNTRDADGSAWELIAPDVPETVNETNIGNLGLTPREEAWIVSFLKTLTDQQ
jgi:cytochrome c peroxidase